MKGKPIDMHVHLTTPGFFRTLGPFVDKLKAYFRADFGEIGIEQALREYEEAGVGRIVLLPIDASRLSGMPGDTNEQMAELQRVDPERVIAFATVDPLAGRRAVMELERAVKDLGLKGLKLHPQLPPRAPPHRRRRFQRTCPYRPPSPSIFGFGGDGQGEAGSGPGGEEPRRQHKMGG